MSKIRFIPIDLSAVVNPPVGTMFLAIDLDNKLKTKDDVGNISQVGSIVVENTAFAGGGVVSAVEMSVGTNILTVNTVGDSIKLPAVASVGDTVEIVANKRYSIFSIVAAPISVFSTANIELQPDLDINGAPVNVRYTLHSNGKWYYSHNHTEL